MKKVPLLQLLQRRYPEKSKKELHAAVLCGEVRVGGERVQDPKRSCAVDAEAEIDGEQRRYVSRGGEKLDAALRRWDVTVRGKVWLDAGASTGGFTDCLLKNGAQLVHAVDVGYNQLDFRLRRNAEVVVHERTNAMALKHLDPQPHAATADLSFRSLRGAAAHILSLTRDGELIALAKPQFETPRLRDEDFDGLVRSAREAENILLALLEDLLTEGVAVHAVMPSPVTGRIGNREFLMRLSPGDAGGVAADEIRKAADEAFVGAE